MRQDVPEIPQDGVYVRILAARGPKGVQPSRRYVRRVDRALLRVLAVGERSEDRELLERFHLEVERLVHLPVFLRETLLIRLLVAGGELGVFFRVDLHGLVQVEEV